MLIGSRRTAPPLSRARGRGWPRAARPGEGERARFPILLFPLFLLITSSLFAAETPIPPSPTRWATDTAGWLDEGSRRSIDSMLEAYQARTGHQILVWIGETTGDTPTEDWTVKAFEAWKIGRKGIDDGLAIFVFTKDRKVRIEVGYGLEGVVPDAIASRVIGESIAPKIKEGDHAGALVAGIEALEKAIDGAAAGGAGTDERAAPDRGGRSRGRAPPSLSIGQKIFFALLAIGFVILLITNPSLAIWLLINILSGGRGGGGGGGGGGGFSGGGGRSGGGGATGSW